MRPADDRAGRPADDRAGRGADGRSEGARGVVVGVLGARGGVGASSLGALVAARASRRTATTLVDLDPSGGGLDVLVGLEEERGARWPDLAYARGDVDGRDVVALLPRWGRVAVLSCDRSRPGALDAATMADVLGSLARASGCLVVDLARADATSAHPALAACDLVALVAARDLRSVAGALALRDALPTSSAGLVVRGPSPGGLGVAEMAEAVGLPLLWAGRADRRLARAAEQGLLPSHGPAARAAAAVLARVL